MFNNCNNMLYNVFLKEQELMVHARAVNNFSTLPLTYH